MPSLVAAADTFASSNTSYSSLGSIAAALPAQGATVPLFGRGIDGDLNVSFAYDVTATRNSTTSSASGCRCLGGSILYNLTGNLAAVGAGLVGQYVWHSACQAGTRVLAYVASRTFTGSGSGTIISGITTTAGLAVGQVLTGSTIPGNAYIVSINNLNSINISASVTTSGATGTITAAEYIVLNKAPTPGLSTDTASFQSLPQPRARDMPYGKVTAMSGDSKTLTVNFPYLSGIPILMNEFYPGDVLMIINQMGDASGTGNVGTYEFAAIASTTATTITLRQGLSRIYGRNTDNGVLTGQVVNFYRVPEYRQVAVTSSGSIVAPAFNYNTAGQTAIAGGVLPLFVDALDCQGNIDANGLGYVRTSGVNYFAAPANDTTMTKLMMGAPGTDNGVAGGGVLFLAARTINRLNLRSQGAAGTSGAGATGGQAVLLCKNLDLPGTLNLTAQGAGATLGVAGKIKAIYQTAQGLPAASSSDGAGNFTFSSPNGYKQSL